MQAKHSVTAGYVRFSGLLPEIADGAGNLAWQKVVGRKAFWTKPLRGKLRSFDLLAASAEQRQRSPFADLCLWRAKVCNQKAEVGEGAGEGAESLPTDFYKDLECFCLPSVPMVSMGYDQKHFCHGRGRGQSF
jgi:hypothetical protein